MQSIDEIVKPLPFERGDYLYAYAPKIPTGYCISFEDCQYWLTIDGASETLKGPFGTEGEAVAAAQSHFNAAIASAIDLDKVRRETWDEHHIGFITPDAFRQAALGLDCQIIHADNRNGFSVPVYVRLAKGGQTE